MAGAAAAGPAPVENYGAKPLSPNGAVIARKGDTITSIARIYKVSPQELAAANNLPLSGSLWSGQRIVLPTPKSHRVRPNDTMFSLSRMYGTTVDALAGANGIGPPYSVKVGQVLRIPSGNPAPMNSAAISPPAERPVTAGRNEDSPQLLKKPGPSPVTKAFDALLGKLARGEASEEETVREISLVSAATAVPETKNAETVGRSRRAGFIWPVKGQVISSYGPKTGGLYNDGINIAAPRGTPVRAASDGTVAYVGDKLKSYGNLVLIRHNNGMVTTYAHLSNVTVRAGSKVAQGQVIGSVGSTGTVVNAQLHFEVRRGKNTVDPKEYLG